jgi:uncharacterized protein (TIGR02099 family)
MTFRPALRLLRHGSLGLYRLATYTLIAAALAVGCAVVVLRYWLLPDIGRYRPQLEAAIVRASGQHVTLGAVAGEWDGLRPRLALHDVRLYDASGEQRLVLGQVDATLSWTSLLVGEVRFHAIELTGLALDVRRDRAGTLLVGGMPVTQASGDRGVGDWLLDQGSIAIYDSSLTWTDETLGGDALRLASLQLLVEKRFGVHRFGLHATPPLDVASPLEMRGELTRGPAGASGRVYLQLAYADLGGLRQWVRLPAEIARGAGGLEVWLDLERGAVRAATADVVLSDVSMRLRADLPALELANMSGRLAWSDGAHGTRIAATNLSFTTPDGLRLAPAGIAFSRSGPDDDLATRSQLRFDSLDVAAVTRLVDRLPLDAALREQLEQMDPRGTLRNFELAWTGPWSWQTRFEAGGSFERLSLEPWGKIPGFSGLSGALRADQDGGSMELSGAQAELSLPRVFVLPLPLDSFAAKLAWTMQPDGPLVRFESIRFANAHLAGSVAGSYRAVSGTPGSVDLAGTLERSEASHVWRYVPLVVNQDARDWVQRALRAGSGSGVRFQLRGDLARFPFTDGESGLFEVVVPVRNAVLEYAPGWPAVEGAAAEVVFRGAGMQITGRTGRILGVRVANARASIADLGARDPVLVLQADAEGPTAEFLDFIARSPVQRMIGGFTEGMTASGRGALALSLEMPLKHAADLRLSGRYRFAGNSLDPAPGAPRMEQFSGQLLFSERGVRLTDGYARVMGIPARLSAENAPGGGLVVRGNGRAEAGALAALFAHSGFAALGGAADWQGTLALRGADYDLNIDSDLRGLSSALPAPLAKPAAAPMPLKLQRRSLDARRELLNVSFGSALAARLLRARDDAGSVLRGEVRLNAPAPAPERDGLWLEGRLAALDLDRWWGLLGAPSSARVPGLSGLALRADTVRWLKRDWHEVSLQAKGSAERWVGGVESREAVGSLYWTQSGPGAVTARFVRLYLPASVEEASAAAPPPAAPTAVSYPALDIAADEFRLGERDLGKLTLLATPENGDWRVRQLDVVNPDGSISLNGLWQAGGAAPQTRIEINAHAVDIGRYFARLRLPPGVKGGSASLQGRLAWTGSPQAIDLPTLSGELRLDARNGQFVRVEPGIAKLIGVISLQGLPRRVALDFRDVFSEGFAFDRISGTTSIARGVAHTGDLRMLGTAARVEMRGDVNLAGETQRLQVKVVPAMSESVALGAAIVNPAVGLATLLAQKALKDPIGQAVAFEYDVSGTWSEPVVMKLQRGAGAGSQGRK